MITTSSEIQGPHRRPAKTPAYGFPRRSRAREYCRSLTTCKTWQLLTMIRWQINMTCGYRSRSGRSRVRRRWTRSDNAAKPDDGGYSALEAESKPINISNGHESSVQHTKSSRILPPNSDILFPLTWCLCMFQRAAIVEPVSIFADGTIVDFKPGYDASSGCYSALYMINNGPTHFEVVCNNQVPTCRS